MHRSSENVAQEIQTLPEGELQPRAIAIPERPGTPCQRMMPNRFKSFRSKDGFARRRSAGQN